MQSHRYQEASFLSFVDHKWLPFACHQQQSCIDYSFVPIKLANLLAGETQSKSSSEDLQNCTWMNMVVLQKCQPHSCKVASVSIRRIDAQKRLIKARSLTPLQFAKNRNTLKIQITVANLLLNICWIGRSDSCIFLLEAGSGGRATWLCLAKATWKTISVL